MGVRGGWGEKRDASRHPLNGLVKLSVFNCGWFYSIEKAHEKSPRRVRRGLLMSGGLEVWGYSTMRGVLSQAKESATDASSSTVSTLTSIPSKGPTGTVTPGESI